MRVLRRKACRWSCESACVWRWQDSTRAKQNNESNHIDKTPAVMTVVFADSKMVAKPPYLGRLGAVCRRVIFQCPSCCGGATEAGRGASFSAWSLEHASVLSPQRRAASSSVEQRRAATSSVEQRRAATSSVEQRRAATSSGEQRRAAPSSVEQRRAAASSVEQRRDWGLSLDGGRHWRLSLDGGRH